MIMNRIKLLDSPFNNGLTTCDIQKSNFINWDRNVNKHEDLIVFTDNFIRFNKNYESKKIALIIEPKIIIPQTYDWVFENYNDFDFILTHNKYLIDNLPNTIFYPHGGCWIYSENQNIWEKNKNLSIISSEKKFTFGQKLRHEIIDFLNQINFNYDCYGRGYNPVENKIYALQDYRFSIVVENSREDFYFSEKIIDCMRTGTIPIYWGCPSISNFFDARGIIQFESLDDLSIILGKLNDELYNSMLEYTHENFKIAEEYLLIENWIYKNTKCFT